MSQYDAIRHEMMVEYLRGQQERMMWSLDEPDEGVVLRRARGEYVCCPPDLAKEPFGLYKAIQQMNVRVAMTANTGMIKTVLYNNSLPYIEIQNKLRVQVLPDISYLPGCQKHQFAAFIADRGILVVWDDQPNKIIERVSNIENALLQHSFENEGEMEVIDEKQAAADEVVEMGSDVEAADEKPRQRKLFHSVLCGAAMAVMFAATGTGWRKIAIAIAGDGNFVRAAFIAVLIPQLWLGLFFFQSLVCCIAQLFGPIDQVKQNTLYFSGKPSKRLNRDTAGGLPHVTIQCPVYKEGLISVIQPTIHSIKAAISTYEMQGGTANIFINDDGMQLIGEEEARARQEFYAEHNIGWVSRPKHNPNPEEGQPFLRRGKFKKASNMNYALWVSNRVEDQLLAVERPESWSQRDEAEAYNNALAEVVAQDEGRTWADGNIRIGDYVLLIDSDTRVPKDCFLDAVSEMEQSPEVGILQYSCGVMNVTDSFFERGITFFTNLIYTQIRYIVACGDVAPFVGHNAWLRWSAVQNIAYECKLDHREKYWSENTVSEDFDMALRLQTEGNIVRLAAYMGDGYKEGVSLTVYDELARWEKYAYGCNELIFHPLKDWPFRGPFTKLFRNFICSGMPFSSKLGIMGYIGTYYAIGSAWCLTLANYFIIGWFNGYHEKYYAQSFDIWFALILVFNGLGNVALGVLRYRTGEKTLLSSLVENFKWIPLMTIFIGGLSLHVSQALLCHMFSIDMSWGATSKEAENISFFEEIPRVLKSFKYTFVFCILGAALLVAGAVVFPPLLQIDRLTAILPFSITIVFHFLLPIVLNPNLMLFTW